MKIVIKDKILIRRTQNNDKDAFGKIYDQYVKKIYRFVFFKVPTKEQAEDLTHETFVNLLTHIQTNERQIENLQAFIYKIARNLIAEYYQAQHRFENQTEELLPDDKMGGQEVVDEIDLVGELDKNIDIEKVLVAIQKINNEDYREIILLRYVEDMDFDEIGTVMNRGSGTLRVLLHRAMHELKKILLKP